MKCLIIVLTGMIALTACSNQTEINEQTTDTKTELTDPASELDDTTQATEGENKILENYETFIISGRGTEEEFFFFEGAGYGGNAEKEVTYSENVNMLIEGEIFSSVDKYFMNWEEFQPNCHKTAWVSENSQDEKFIQFTFRDYPSDLTSVSVINGYGRIEEEWQKHGRVKTMEVYKNGEYFTTIHFQDTMFIQETHIHYLHTYAEPLPVTFKFVITEIYNGNEFDDVALTDLNFGVSY